MAGTRVRGREFTAAKRSNALNMRGQVGPTKAGTRGGSENQLCTLFLLLAVRLSVEEQGLGWAEGKSAPVGERSWAMDVWLSVMLILCRWPPAASEIIPASACLMVTCCSLRT